VSDATVAARPPPWRDVRVLRVAAQILFVALVVAFLWFLWFNLLTNMRNQGIRTDYGFLDRRAGFRIAGTDFSSRRPLLDALLIGVKNTALVVVLGIALATVLGVVVGVARLSTNVLVRRAASVYVESLRNIPVLVIIIFWSTAVILKLPSIREPIAWPGFIVSNRGMRVPWTYGRPGLGAYWTVLVFGLVLAGLLAVWRTRRFDATGAPHHRWAWGLTAFAVVAVAGYLALGRPFSVSLPSLDGIRITGGSAVGPEYAAVLLGLVVYTASHIAEIVRGSILAVSKGQTEAATAVGLGPAQRLRLVILPQAFRVAVPPLANQFLNLTKNSSLGIAVAYAEISAITFVAIGNGAPAPQSISIMMLVYLAFSLGISALTNLANRRLQISGSR